MPADDEAFRTAAKHGFFVPDKILSHIGLVVLCQSYVETELVLQIARLLGIHQHDARSMTAKMSFRSLCEALQSLVFYRLQPGSTVADEFRDIVRRVISFEEFRNNVAHSLWAHGSEIDRPTSFKVGRKKNSPFQINTAEWSAEEISKKVGDCKEALGRLISLIMRLAPAVPDGDVPRRRHQRD